MMLKKIVALEDISQDDSRDISWVGSPGGISNISSPEKAKVVTYVPKDFTKMTTDQVLDDPLFVIPPSTEVYLGPQDESGLTEAALLHLSGEPTFMHTDAMSRMSSASGRSVLNKQACVSRKVWKELLEITQAQGDAKEQLAKLISSMVGGGKPSEDLQRAMEKLSKELNELGSKHRILCGQTDDQTHELMGMSEKFLTLLKKMVAYRDTTLKSLGRSSGPTVRVLTKDAKALLDEGAVGQYLLSLLEICSGMTAEAATLSSSLSNEVIAMTKEKVRLESVLREINETHSVDEVALASTSVEIERLKKENDELRVKAAELEQANTLLAHKQWDWQNSLNDRDQKLKERGEIIRSYQVGINRLIPISVSRLETVLSGPKYDSHRMVVLSWMGLKYGEIQDALLTQQAMPEVTKEGLKKDLSIYTKIKFVDADIEAIFVLTLQLLSEWRAKIEIGDVV